MTDNNNEITRDDHGRRARTLLRGLLTIVDPEAEVIKVTEAAVWANGIRDVPVPGGLATPTHAVFDADGDAIGRGLSEDEAIADAVAAAYRVAEERIEKYQSGLRAYRKARSALDELI